MPKISVIIPTYNKADYISQTIESVLNQTEKDFEILIVDDFSDDNTEEVVKKYLSKNITYYRHDKNLGPGATFNDGIEKAACEYITIIASDDLLISNHLEMVLETFKQNNSVECIFAKLKIITEKNIESGEIIEVPAFNNKYELLNGLFYYGNEIPSPGISFKKSLFSKIDKFNKNLILTHDYDMNVRAIMNADIAVLNQATVLYRRFSDNTTNLSAYSNWSNICSAVEYKKVYDNFLKLPYTDMIKVFPQLKHKPEKDLLFYFLIDTIKQDTRDVLIIWAYENLLLFLEQHNFFKKNADMEFQYKDYIHLYKQSAMNSVGNTHKQKLYNKIKKLIKLFFGLK